VWWGLGEGGKETGFRGRGKGCSKIIYHDEEQQQCSKIIPAAAAAAAVCII
jgi:hypothetical protein